MLALAHNYDQVRYTSCIDRAPRHPGGPADAGDPHAPLARFAFRPPSWDLCVWTSYLLFSAPVALAWRLSEAMGARTIHSIRQLGEWRLPCLFLVASSVILAWPRADRRDIAVAYLAWLALYSMVRASIVYVIVFYTEAAVIIGFYFCAIDVAAVLVRRISKSVCANGDIEFANRARSSINYALVSLGRVFAVLARRALRREVPP